jgi:transketolase
VASYAAFSPGRNWEQIKTTACLNELPVKIVGSHSGLTDGPDGGTHQITEDIALMRVLPRMVVIAPGDSVEAEKATLAMAKDGRPNYLRLAREKTPIFSTADSPFAIGKAYVLREGADVTLIGTGTMTHQCLTAAKVLEEQGISAEVLHVPTIKPLDAETIIKSIKKTGRAVSVEEAQVMGGLGGAIAELLCEQMPAPLKRLGMDGVFGESGSYAELVAHFGLDAKSIATKTADFIKAVPQYKAGY